MGMGEEGETMTMPEPPEGLPEEEVPEGFQYPASPGETEYGTPQNPNK